MGLRSFFCDIFKCEDFVALKDQLQVIEDGLAGLVPVVAAIAGQFPVVATLPPDALAELHAKLDLLMKNASSIWTPDVVVGGDLDTEFVVSVMVKLDAVQELQAIGFGGGDNAGLVFPATALAFVGIEKGDATQPWDVMAGNEVNPGEVIFGGYMGAGVPVSGEGIYEIARLRFRVLVAHTPGTSASIGIQNYIDDVASFLPSTCIAVVHFE